MTVRAFPHWDSATPHQFGGFGGTWATYSVVRSEILGGTVSASTVYSTSVADYARDGSAGTQWHSQNTAANPWIMLDLGTAQNVSQMSIQQRAEAVHKFKDVLIEYSTDNSVWIPVAAPVVTLNACIAAGNATANNITANPTASLSENGLSLYFASGVAGLTANQVYVMWANTSVAQQFDAEL